MGSLEVCETSHAQSRSDHLGMGQVIEYPIFGREWFSLKIDIFHHIPICGLPRVWHVEPFQSIGQGKGVPVDTLALNVALGTGIVADRLEEATGEG